jgi:hypothetical protein
MTENREIQLEIRGKSCFVAALQLASDKDWLNNATTLEKEGALLSIVEQAHELLESSVIQLGEILSDDERIWVDRGISLACEEWLRSPEDINTVGV